MESENFDKMDRVIKLLEKANEHLRRIDFDISVIKKSMREKKHEKNYKYKHNNSNNYNGYGY